MVFQGGRLTTAILLEHELSLPVTPSRCLAWGLCAHQERHSWVAPDPIREQKKPDAKHRVLQWAEVEPNQHDQNHVGDIENKENDNTHTQGGPKCAPFENKSEQFAQLLQAFQALTQDERNALLQALGLGGGGV